MKKKATKTVKRERKAQDQSEMVVGGGGQWVIKNGMFYDPQRKKWIRLCRNCKQSFYAKRRDAKTCGGACRVAILRKSAKKTATGQFEGMPQ